MDNILQLRNLCFAYHDGKSVVDDVSLEIKSGKIMALLGPSGCGKTSILRLVAGLEAPTHGEIILYGKPVASGAIFVTPELREVGMLFQDYALFPHLSVASNVGFAARVGRRKDKSVRIAKLLEMVDLLPFVDHYPHMLSGGQQQRVALARAIAAEPKLLLLDEPFSGLDARLRDEVRDRTLHVIQETGIAALMVTHDADEAMYMADYIAVMRDGSLVQSGTPQELYYRPKDIFTARFLSTVNLFSLPVEGGKVATPFGAFASPAKGVKTVDVVIRPDGLKLQKSAQNHIQQPHQMRVMAARLVGGASLVHLYCPLLEAQDVHLHARVTGRFLPKIGDVMDVAVDEDQLFIFPAQ